MPNDLVDDDGIADIGLEGERRADGLAPLRISRTNVSLTRATFGEEMVSRSVKSRPDSTDVPSALKKPGADPVDVRNPHRRLDRRRPERVRSSRCRSRARSPPRPRHRRRALRRRARASRRCISPRLAGSRSSGCMSTDVTSRPSGRKPGSRARAGFMKVRTKSSAPTISTSDSATCAATSTRPAPNRARSAVRPRPAAFMTTPGAVRDARIAGASPKSMTVNTPSAAVNARTRQSDCTSTTITLRPASRSATSARLAPCATSDTGDRPERGEQQAFDKELADQPSARCAQARAGPPFRARGRWPARAAGSPGWRRR